MKPIFFLALIIVLAFFLRVINIQNNPPSLYGDELTIVLDAKSLLETGMDQTGEVFPITFSMGAGRPAGYVYGLIPFVALFGANEIGVRALSILSGIGIVFLLYILGKRFFDTKVGLIAAFLGAISPWSLSISRGGFEAHFALFLALLTVVTFLEAEKKAWFYLISAITFIICLHTYPTFKLTLPLLIALLIWFSGYKLDKQKLSVSLIAAIIIVVLGLGTLVSQTLTSGSEARFWNINIFAQMDLKKSLIENINIDRNADSLPRFISPLFHNKFIEYPLILGEAYLKNFSFDFLFLHGDKNPRHNMMTAGGFYLVEMFTIIAGLLVLYKKRKLFYLLMGWILIAPIATAILLEPHFLRSSLMLPPLLLLSALGVNHLINSWKNLPFWKYGLFLILLFQIIILFERLYFVAPNEFSNFWAYPAKKVSQVVLENKDTYSEIIISDRVDNIEFAYPVYSNVSSATVIEQNKQKIIKDGYNFKKFDNVYIGSIPEAFLGSYLASRPDTLYIGSVEEKDALKDYDTILGKDGLPGFLLVGRQHLR